VCSNHAATKPGEEQYIKSSLFKMREQIIDKEKIGNKQEDEIMTPGERSGN
jgi:hypothetical protein